MKRLNKENPNTPEWFNNHFDGKLAVADIERLEKMAKHFKGGDFIELGCWDSPLPIILSERFPESQIYALDFADKVVDFLAPRFPKVRWIRHDFRFGIPLSNDPSNPFYNYIVAGEVIEHMEDPKKFVEDCLRGLKKGGWLAISTPHIEIEKQHKIGGPLHLWSLDEKDLKDLGFTEIEINREGDNLSWIAWQQKE